MPFEEIGSGVSQRCVWNTNTVFYGHGEWAAWRPPITTCRRAELGSLFGAYTVITGCAAESNSFLREGLLWEKQKQTETLPERHELKFYFHWMFIQLCALCCEHGKRTQTRYSGTAGLMLKPSCWVTLLPVATLHSAASNDVKADSFKRFVSFLDQSLVWSFNST